MAISQQTKKIQIKMFKYLDKVDFNKNDLPLLLKKVR
jgi:hypothetical protein